MKFKSRESWLFLVPLFLILAANAWIFSNASQQTFFSAETTTAFSATVVEVRNPEKIESCTIRTEEYGEKIHLSHLGRWVEPEDLTVIKPGDTIYFRVPSDLIEADTWLICTLETEDISIVSLDERSVANNQDFLNIKTAIAICSIACVAVIIFVSWKIRKDLKEQG